MTGPQKINASELNAIIQYGTDAASNQTKIDSLQQKLQSSDVFTVAAQTKGAGKTPGTSDQAQKLKDQIAQLTNEMNSNKSQYANELASIDSENVDRVEDAVKNGTTLTDDDLKSGNQSQNKKNNPFLQLG